MTLGDHLGNGENCGWDSRWEREAAELPAARQPLQRDGERLLTDDNIDNIRIVLAAEGPRELEQLKREFIGSEHERSSVGPETTPAGPE